MSYTSKKKPDSMNEQDIFQLASICLLSFSGSIFGSLITNRIIERRKAKKKLQEDLKAAEKRVFGN